MLRISKQNDDVLIREISYNDFIEKGLPALLFLLVMSFLGLNEIKTDIFMIVLSIGLLIFIIYKFCSVQLMTLKINKNKRIVSVQKRSLIKNKFSVYRFGEIAGNITVVWTKPATGKITYRILMPLDSGEKVELASPISSRTVEYQDAADLLNHLIFNQPAQLPQNLSGIYKI